MSQNFYYFSFWLMNNLIITASISLSKLSVLRVWWPTFRSVLVLTSKKKKCSNYSRPGSYIQGIEDNISDSINAEFLPASFSRQRVNSSAFE